MTSYTDWLPIWMYIWHSHMNYLPKIGWYFIYINLSVSPYFGVSILVTTLCDGEKGVHRASSMYHVVQACVDFGPVLTAVSLSRVEEISKGMKILVF